MQLMHKTSIISSTDTRPSAKIPPAVNMQRIVHMQRTVNIQPAANKKRDTPMQGYAATWKSDGKQSPMGIGLVPVVCVWLAGLLLAGSDGPFMPWLNGLGALVFAGAGLVLARMSARLDAKDQKRVTPPYCRPHYGRPQPMAEKAMAPEKESPKIGRPYAVGF